METKVMTMPVIALRALTVLPKMTVSFDISRSRSVAAVERAMISDQRVCVVTQRDPDDADPGMEQLYHIGVIVKVKQLVKMPNSVVRVMVEAPSMETCEAYVDQVIEVMEKQGHFAG